MTREQTGEAPRCRRVLVTGATGFVGSAIARALLSAGHDVVGLVRARGGAAGRLEADGMRLAVGDMLLPDSYRPLVGDVDAVMHAAQYGVSGRLTSAKMARIRAADHLMTDTLARACLAGGKRFVYTSGVFNYGDHGAAWITEATPFTPSPLGVGHAAEVTTPRRGRRRAGVRLRARWAVQDVLLRPGAEKSAARHRVGHELLELHPHR